MKRIFIFSALTVIFVLLFVSLSFAADFASGDDISLAFSELSAYFPEFNGERVRKADLLTALLTALGYSPENGDYLSEFPFDKAAEIGLIKALDYSSPYLTLAELEEYALSYKAVNSSGVDLSPTLGLVGYYDPTASENSVNVYNSALERDKMISSEKFFVSAKQERGIYYADVMRHDKPLFEDSEGYFVAFGFTGSDLTINIGLRCDIKSGYSIRTTGVISDSSFDNGILSITLSEPQILTVVFDDAAGKTLTIPIIDGNFDNSDVSALFDSDLALSVAVEKSSSYIFPAKISFSGKQIYAESVIRNGSVYLADHLYSGIYSGNVYTADGVAYIPLDAFEALGFDLISYDGDIGLISVSSSNTEKEIAVGSYKGLGGIAVEYKAGKYIVSSDGEAEVFTETTSEITLANSLYFDALSKADRGVKLKYSLVGVTDRGEKEVISSFEIYFTGLEKSSAGFFDISKADEFYEAYYLTISSDTPGSFSISDGTLTFDDFNFGDNEFNPFG